MSDLYERKMFYSKEDQSWIAVAPKLPGCSAFGKTRNEARRELDIAINLWFKAAKSNKWSGSKGGRN